MSLTRMALIWVHTPSVTKVFTLVFWARTGPISMSMRDWMMLSALNTTRSTLKLSMARGALFSTTKVRRQRFSAVSTVLSSRPTSSALRTDAGTNTHSNDRTHATRRISTSPGYRNNVQASTTLAMMSVAHNRPRRAAVFNRCKMSRWRSASLSHAGDRLGEPSRIRHRQRASLADADEGRWPFGCLDLLLGGMLR